MKLSRRFTLTMATVALVIYATKSARSDELRLPAATAEQAPAPASTSVAAGVQIQEEWTMEIQPAIKRPAVPSIPIDARPAAEPGTDVIDPSAYSRIYNSIPFNRVEYDANPNYRHDSTMEILTGNARHQTIVQHNFEHKQPVKRIPAPAGPSRALMPYWPYGLPFGSSVGNGFGFGFGFGFGHKKF